MTARRAIATLTLAALAARWASAQPAIDPDAKRAWGEAVGWTNWADAAGGAGAVRRVGAALTGFVWSERAGWIDLGAPGAGVTVGAGGALGGLAWSERGGWINAGTTPTLGEFGARLVGHRLRGFMWSERLGWINLDSDAPGAFVAFVCPADLNGDGAVGGADISAILNVWGGAGPADLSGDGVVNGADISFVLSAWGPC